MGIMVRGLLHGFGTLEGVRTVSDASRSPLLVLTLLGCTARSDSSEKPTDGSGRVLGVFWALSGTGALDRLLGAMGAGAKRPEVTEMLGGASEPRRLLENVFGSAFGAFCANSEGAVGPRASTVDAGA